MLERPCHCALCRGYGALFWGYDYEDAHIHIFRPGKANPPLDIRFCRSGGCAPWQRGLRLEPETIAVNLQLTPPEVVADLPVDHFDGIDMFDDLPRDGRCIRDYWF